MLSPEQVSGRLDRPVSPKGEVSAQFLQFADERLNSYLAGVKKPGANPITIDGDTYNKGGLRISNLGAVEYGEKPHALVEVEIRGGGKIPTHIHEHGHQRAVATGEVTFVTGDIVRNQDGTYTKEEDGAILFENLLRRELGAEELHTIWEGQVHGYENLDKDNPVSVVFFFPKKHIEGDSLPAREVDPRTDTEVVEIFNARIHAQGSSSQVN